MSVFVSSVRGTVAPRDPEFVSPELVLVDPELAASARARLPDRDLPSPSPRLVSTEGGNENADLLRALSDAALTSLDEHVETDARRNRSWRLLVSVAAVTVVGLLLFDVRVLVGKTPASAKRPELERTSITPRISPPGQTPETGRQEKRSRGSLGQPAPRRFAWAPTPGAVGYHMELFSGTVRVFSAGTARPELTIPARWKHRGNDRSLRPGEYRWYVWPVISGRRASQAIVQAELVVR